MWSLTVHEAAPISGNQESGWKSGNAQTALELWSGSSRKVGVPAVSERLVGTFLSDLRPVPGSSCPGILHSNLPTTALTPF